MKVPKPITRLIESFERLPGIGPKTAQRLTFFLLHFPEEEIEKFSKALLGLKSGTKLCSKCKNVTEFEVCTVCDDPGRDQRLIAVVASPLDAFAIEKTGFKGVYHVLHGVIDPLNNIGPEEIFIKELMGRVKDLSDEVSFDSFGKSGDKDSGDEKASDSNGKNVVEVILATNTSMEGESTAMYIVKMFRDAGFDENKLKITRIARGLPVGGDIEYADDITLSRALDGRLDY